MHCFKLRHFVNCLNKSSKNLRPPPPLVRLHGPHACLVVNNGEGATLLKSEEHGKKLGLGGGGGGDHQASRPDCFSCKISMMCYVQSTLLINHTHDITEHTEADRLFYHMFLMNTHISSSPILDTELHSIMLGFFWLKKGNVVPYHFCDNHPFSNPKSLLFWSTALPSAET